MQNQNLFESPEFHDWVQSRFETNSQEALPLPFWFANSVDLDLPIVAAFPLPVSKQLASVQNHGFAIQWIENPSVELQLAAVKQNPFALQVCVGFGQDCIRSFNEVAQSFNEVAPTFDDLVPIEVQLAAVQQIGAVIEWIPNPCEEVQLAAVNQDGNAIKFIGNPSEAVQLAAVNQNEKSIHLIKNKVCEKLLLKFKQTKRLPPDTECLIMGDVIGVGEYYKMCSNREDHVVSYEVWKTLDAGETQDKCCYCKGNLHHTIFENN